MTDLSDQKSWWQDGFRSRLSQRLRKVRLSEIKIDLRHKNLREFESSCCPTNKWVFRNTSVLGRAVFERNCLTLIQSPRTAALPSDTHFLWLKQCVQHVSPNGLFLLLERNLPSFLPLPKELLASLSSQSLIAQLCPTLCDLLDYSSPGSSVHRILQVRMLEWVAITFSRGSSLPSDQTPGLPCCKRTLYHLSIQRSPSFKI